MTDQQSLLRNIEAFLDRHHMEATFFGTRAMKDGHLVFDLRRGHRKLRRKSIARIEAYMAKRDEALARKSA